MTIKNELALTIGIVVSVLIVLGIVHALNDQRLQDLYHAAHESEMK